jgi:hypothetical protein
MPIRLLDPWIQDGHPLVLVHDPDGILDDEALLASLTRQGYAVIRESDPVALRYEVQRARAQAGQRTMIITKHELERLPYDLWQQGQHITLALHELFPRLDSYHVGLLRGPARRRLAEAYQARPPARYLSPVETQDYLLREVFDAAPERLDRPASLLLWLDAFHKAGQPMGFGLIQRLLAHLQGNPAYAGWPLSGMLLSGENYREFVRDAWQREVGHFLGEERIGYQALPFSDDEALQDALPRLVRTGTVEPVAVDRSVRLPAWAAPAVAVDAAAVRRRQLDEAMEAVADDLRPEELRWEQWQAVARRWAQVSLWRYDTDFGVTPAQREQLASLEAALDGRFAAWLQANYALLAGMALPRPHHLYHTLGYTEYINQRIHRVALIVLDGLSLADWTLIRPAWQMRHHEWEISEHLVLAQVPSVTSVSRQALVSGLRPARLADTLLTTQHEGRRWREFWQARYDVAPDRLLYGALDDRSATPLLADILSQRTMAACLVSTAIDNMLHGATQGAADAQASLRLWLADGSHRLEALIDLLLDERIMVVLASDHGHVEAVGMGRPQEGVLVESRSQRARLYTNADFARTVQAQYPETILWSDNALLPSGWHALMPTGRRSFAPQGTRVVSHGGLTIDEMVVPLLHIER